MARKRSPCWFCESEHMDTTTDERGIQLTAEVYPDNELIGIVVNGNPDGGEFVEIQMDIEMHYCPVCGRKCGF